MYTEELMDSEFPAPHGQYFSYETEPYDHDFAMISHSNLQEIRNFTTYCYNIDRLPDGFDAMPLYI